MAAATASPPVIPPRPSKSDDKASTSAPMVPPRPTNKRVHRPLSPNPERFAPSPLNESVFLKSPKGLQPHNGDPIPRSTSVELPSLGEEGKEYDNLAEELSPSDDGSASPEQTRTVAQDLKLHAPKPSLPASSAKQRVMAVTRTDSERAASFGIGRASSIDESTAAQPSNRSLRKKASTASQLSTAESHIDDEQGIPEIGLQVPMYKNAGDVQAPSPAPASAEGTKGRHHTRKTSSRGNLPPGSYGLHGHGVAPQDKLEKAYFEKHPDLLRKEKVQHHYDRPNDYSMSREGLDKIVQETAAHGHGLAVKDYAGTPSDQVGWQALEESASRIASPGVASPELKPQAIHVDEPNRRRSVMFSDTESANGAEEVDRPYTAPILAEDEVAKDPKGNAAQPAVTPPFELEEPGSRPSSRPASVHRGSSFELRSTPLEDVEEYEPLFKDDDKKDVQPPVKEEKKHRNSIPNRFPSADVWEDAPSSVFYTAEVSTPELFDEQDKEEKPSPSNIPSPREGETAAQAFARHQEELAEKEAHGQRALQKPVWAQHQKHLTGEKSSARPIMQQRFPSRDVWEDAPESLQLETTVSTPQQDDAPSPSPADTLRPDIPERPQPKSPEVSAPAPAPSEKPSIPDRPKPRQPSSTDDKPAIPERPKPAIPPRPVKAGPTSGGLEPAEAAAPPRQKPAVPARPMGSKIAALQAGFMNDLNRRLQLGPQAPPAKKEESHEGEGEGEKAAEEKEKVPLADARKGRARGPQRRAPAAASVAPAAAAAEEKSKPAAAVVFGVSKAVTFFEIDPDEGVVKAGAEAASASAPAAAAAEQEKEAQESATAPQAEAEPQTAPAPAPASESQAEAAPEPDAKAAVTTAPASEPQATEPEPEAATETKSLATNMAGETLVAEQVKKEDGEDEGGVEPVKVVEN